MAAPFAEALAKDQTVVAEAQQGLEQDRILPGTGRGTVRRTVERSTPPIGPTTMTLRAMVPLPVPGRIFGAGIVHQICFTSSGMS
jgi:hypothetical protein